MEKDKCLKLKKRVGYNNTAYFEAKAKLPKPDGKHCIICGKELPKRRRKYCSDECFNKWYEKILPRMDWSVLREKALKRDHYTCVKCGKKYADLRLMIVDHIVPIALGGKEFDLDNLQTLCWECNKIKTKEDMKKIAELRRKIKIFSDGQKQLT